MKENLLALFLLVSIGVSASELSRTAPKKYTKTAKSITHEKYIYIKDFPLSDPSLVLACEAIFDANDMLEESKRAEYPEDFIRVDPEIIMTYCLGSHSVKTLPFFDKVKETPNKYIKFIKKQTKECFKRYESFKDCRV